MPRKPIDPDVGLALVAFLTSQGMAAPSAEGVVAALSRDLASGLPAAARIHQGLVRRAIAASRDSIVGLAGEIADLSGRPVALQEA